MKNKYYNKKVLINGIKFDSKKEGNIYIKLKLLEKQGLIKDLRMQVKYELQPSFKINGKTIRSINYVADFVYLDNKGIEHIIDVKGYKTEVYKLKAKLFAYKYRKEIEEWR